MSGLKRSGLGVCVSLATSLCLGSWAGEAFAQSESGVQACARAYEEAQVQRNGGHLKGAQERLRICVQDVCPDFVRADCNQWLQEVNAALPTVTFGAVDSAGADLFDVKVSVDGVVVAESLDGRALDIDPGQHSLVFEYQGQKIEQKLLVRQGEKNRVVRVQIKSEKDTDGDGVMDSIDKCLSQAGDAEHQGCPADVTPPPPPADKNGGMSPLLLGAYISGGVAAAGFLTSGIFYLLEKAEYESAIDECGGDKECSPERTNELIESNRFKANMETTGLIVGGVGLVTGGVLFYLWYKDHQGAAQASPAEQTTGVHFDVAASQQGGFLQMSGAF